jgi:Holliday junction resolvase RusA-like endonuclease
MSTLRSRNYLVLGTPTPWKRARLCGKRFFDGQIEDKEMFRLEVGLQHGNEPLFSNKIELDVTFYMGIPEGHARKKRYELAMHYHGKYPDLDNLCKYLLDSIQSVIITDDKLVCSIKASKIYDEIPRVEFKITEVE